MNIWMIGEFNETSFPEKEHFYNHLNMEYIVDADYVHARVCKDFEIKNLGECHDSYVQSDALLLKMYLRSFEICVLKYNSLILQKIF